jgi:hypothetical protein
MEKNKEIIIQAILSENESNHIEISDQDLLDLLT